jgi:uncharacterized repeat protein (TIGR03803 family)
VLIAGLGLVQAGQLSGQTFTVLHTFSTAGSARTNNDGVAPTARLTLSGNTLYGIAKFGGRWGAGTAFVVNTDGTGFGNLHSFTNADGTRPYAGLVLSGKTLYGTAEFGGSGGAGTVFAVNTDGTGFTNLHSFTTNEGGYPVAGLTLSGSRLFGAASGGNSGGTVFALNTDGTGFMSLHTFIGSDGGFPIGQLLLVGDTLYGTTSGGGNWGSGTVFKLKTDGTGFTNLYHFTAASCPGSWCTNVDGSSPQAGLILVSNNTLYGTTVLGGTWGYGTVFALGADATVFRTLYSFPATPSSGAIGGLPSSDLLFLDGHILYGTARIGGFWGAGSVFAINTDGTGFQDLYSFNGADGNEPYGGLILLGNTLYGAASGGGSSGSGLVFSLSFSPRTMITSSGANMILSWPTNYAGFDYTGYNLESTTNLASPVWTTNLPAPIVVNGLNTVTNPISGMQQFFRLSQ